MWLSKLEIHTAWKASVFGVFSGPYFPASGWMRIQSECGKMLPRKTQYEHFLQRVTNSFTIWKPKQNPVRHLRWSAYWKQLTAFIWKLLTIFAKSSIYKYCVWQSSECNSVLYKYWSKLPHLASRHRYYTYHTSFINFNVYHKIY